MDPVTLEQRFFTLSAWLENCAAPSACAVLFAVFTAMTLGLQGEALDALSGALALCAVFGAGWQGMDRVQALWVHRALRRHHPRRYAERLAALAHPPRNAREAMRVIAWIDQTLHT